MPPDDTSLSVTRYYDPATGQFLSVDPDVDETDEAYGYTGGDPVDASDPSGMMFEAPSLGPWYDDSLLPDYLKAATGVTLRNIINGQYRGLPVDGVRIGDGGAADLLLDEVTSPTWNYELKGTHFQKIDDDIRGLNKIIETDQGSCSVPDPEYVNPDVEIAEQLQEKLVTVRDLASSLYVAGQKGDADTEVSDQFSAMNQLANDDAAVGNVAAAELEIGLIATEEDEGGF
jgi:hypothetical protein